MCCISLIGVCFRVVVLWGGGGGGCSQLYD